MQAVFARAPQAGLGTTTPVRLDQVSDQWWKDAVVYCVDVRAFLDTDGDGIGDLNGMTQIR